MGQQLAGNDLHLPPYAVSTEVMQYAFFVATFSTDQCSSGASTSKAYVCFKLAYYTYYHRDVNEPSSARFEAQLARAHSVQNLGWLGKARARLELRQARKNFESSRSVKIGSLTSLLVTSLAARRK